MKSVLLTLAILFVVLVGLAFVVIFTGAYDVAAAEPEGSMTRWILSATMEHSVKHRADGIPVPSLTDSALIRLGYEHYSEMCVSCHGSPAGGRSEAGLGLNPPAPDLSVAVKDWSPAELYWIIKNGIKMTGMPAFGPTHDEHELWAMVAFVQRLPNLSPEQYKAFSTEAQVGEEEEAENAEESHHHEPRVGKGPHGGFVAEAGGKQMEMVAQGSDLVFYLLDADGKPVDMKDIQGSVTVQYPGKSAKPIVLMEMSGKLTAMGANNGKAFVAVATLTEGSRSYTASFTSVRDSSATRE